MEQLNDLVVAFGVFLGACAAVTAAGSAWAVVQRIRKPAADVAETVEAHGRMLDNDNKRINEVVAGVNLLLKSNMQLLSHEIHGNHVDQMIETHDEIQEYLINR
ncbi:hypothetical protein [Eggerthella lenta]|uniref:hypothetical protein n=1 Tax=Eggerthella lenta TaxID=84112 RepID=UPI0022E20308|nr:hypothetical protein [Eggerthella lenta]